METAPLFKEDMLLALGPGDRYANADSPSRLHPSDEIRLPWNPEYDMWHEYWFKPHTRARMMLDQMSLMGYFLGFRDVWAIVPATAALQMKERLGVRLRFPKDGPPAQFTYYLKSQVQKTEKSQQFLTIMSRKLKKLADKSCHIKSLMSE